MDKKINILFVCLGNICRSPMAEYIMREKISQAGLQQKISVTSAGTSGWHDGEDMHCGTLEILEQHNIPSNGFTSSKVKKADWDKFDYIIAMDNNNLIDLEKIFGHHPDKLFKITELCPSSGYDGIPDPWHTGNFHQTFELLKPCCQALLDKLQQN